MKPVYGASLEVRIMRAHNAGASLRRSRKRRRSGDGEDGDDVSPISMRLRRRKRRKNVRTGGGGYDEEADLEMYESPAGGVSVSAAVIEDSNSDPE